MRTKAMKTPGKLTMRQLTTDREINDVIATMPRPSKALAQQISHNLPGNV